MVHSDEVLRRFARPKFVHRDEELQGGIAGSRLAGAQIEILLGLHDGVWQARFRAYGCPATIASADWLAERLDGALGTTDLPDRHLIIRALELGPPRQHCAALAIEAMQNAVKALKHN